MSNVIAVNSNEMKILNSNLKDTKTKISDAFTDMNDIFNEFGSCIEGDVGSDILSKFSEVRAQNEILLKNLDTFIEDFETANNNFASKQENTKTGEIDVLGEEEIIHVNQI